MASALNFLIIATPGGKGSNGTLFLDRVRLPEHVILLQRNTYMVRKTLTEYQYVLFQIENLPHDQPAAFAKLCISQVFASTS